MEEWHLSLVYTETLILLQSLELKTALSFCCSLKIIDLRQNAIGLLCFTILPHITNESIKSQMYFISTDISHKKSIFLQILSAYNAK